MDLLCQYKRRRQRAQPSNLTNPKGSINLRSQLSNAYRNISTAWRGLLYDSGHRGAEAWAARRVSRSAPDVVVASNRCDCVGLPLAQCDLRPALHGCRRSEEHTSELQ